MSGYSYSFFNHRITSIILGWYTSVLNSSLETLHLTHSLPTILSRKSHQSTPIWRSGTLGLMFFIFRFVRALHYRYEYTKIGSKAAASGEWWKRRKKGVYLPIINTESLKEIMSEQGWEWYKKNKWTILSHFQSFVAYFFKFICQIIIPSIVVNQLYRPKWYSDCLIQ